MRKAVLGCCNVWKFYWHALHRGYLFCGIPIHNVADFCHSQSERKRCNLLWHRRKVLKLSNLVRYSKHRVFVNVVQTFGEEKKSMVSQARSWVGGHLTIRRNDVRYRSTLLKEPDTLAFSLQNCSFWRRKEKPWKQPERGFEAIISHLTRERNKTQLDTMGTNSLRRAAPLNEFPDWQKGGPNSCPLSYRVVHLIRPSGS